jgi:hypothetical protein
MKKTNRKLVLRAETIRELSAQALTRVIGGQGTVPADAVPQTRERQCEAAVAYPYSNPKQCTVE